MRVHPVIRRCKKLPETSKQPSSGVGSLLMRNPQNN